MPRYRKKPIVIEAIKCADAIQFAQHDWWQLPKWLRDAYDKGGIVFAASFISISTLEGEMRAGKDDWLIRGAVGEIYPCRADIFDSTYDPVVTDG